MLNLTGEAVKQSYAGQNARYTMEGFGGECSKPEIERLKQLCTASGADVVVGVGGGKTLDTAKAIAFYAKLPVIVVPTVASTDAPTTPHRRIKKHPGVGRPGVLRLAAGF